MQDRFKFRIYHIPTKTMEYNGQWSGKDYDKKFNDCNFIVMQCTGLKDKNGNLIYEGDIVNMQHWGTPRKIIYINGAYCCGWYMKQIKKEKGCMGEDCLTFSSEHIGKAEIIGNIYENPELLKECE